MFAQVVWGSNKVELVQKAACWRTSVLEPYVLKPMQENIPYDWWLECCMADCPPNWSLGFSETEAHAIMKLDSEFLGSLSGTSGFAAHVISAHSLFSLSI